MLIECPYCESKVDGLERGEVFEDNPEYSYPFKKVLVECSVCKLALLGSTEQYQVGLNEYRWGALHRVWPPQDSDIDDKIPQITRIPLTEARLCFKAKAFSACAVMCGKAIEGLCKHHKTTSNNFAAALKELKERKVIDSRLFQWSEELRKHRNIGAHASNEKISKENAQDLLDFSTAICEYVFILSEKFNRFIERNKKA